MRRFHILRRRTPIMIVRGRTLILAMLGIAAAVTLFVIARPHYQSAAKPVRELPVYSVDRSEPWVSLTFDAAWGNEDTQELIDILARYNAKATFFVVGDWVRRFPESVKALHDAGHEVMSHSDKHKHMNAMSAEQIRADLDTCNRAIAAITGVTPHLFRPPYGEYDNELILTARGMGIEVIQWDVDSHDWMKRSAAQIRERVVSKVRSGSIVLFHNAALNTPAALPGILEDLSGKGFEFVTVSQMLFDGPTKINHEGKQMRANP
jgi:polysaccharide deacetylase family sporulation protein PdaB